MSIRCLVYSLNHHIIQTRKAKKQHFLILKKL